MGVCFWKARGGCPRSRCRTWVRRLLLCLLVAGALFAILMLGWIYWPMDLRPYRERAWSGRMLARDGEILFASVNLEEQWSIPVGLAEINPWLVKATIAVEDHRFRRHHGVDPIAVLRAAGQNFWRGRIYSGASTITMQLVRLVHPRPRSYVWKLLQAVEAIRVERNLSKDEILALYLNIAPYGMNLQGCEAASLRYWGKPTRELTLAEAALLAGLPKSPSRLMPLKHPEKALARRKMVLRRMQEEGVISKALYASTVDRPVTVAWHDFPRHAEHAATGQLVALRAGAVVETTLDSKIQRGLERVILGARPELDPRGLNCAVLVCEPATGAVLGWIGSKGFFDPTVDGQVDCTRALRSPGSTLKPFAYALALQRNVLYSSEGLRDDPLDYGLYRPQNMDGGYRGIVTATAALQQSLNIPAMTVLERLGVTRFCDHLRGLGISSLFRPDPEYGIGLILGNCEVSLWELSGAYCTLAAGGGRRTLHWTPRLSAEVAVKTRDVFTRGTRLAMYRMMEQPLPGQLELPGKAKVTNPLRACWKTGTSTNHRDAWAMVFNNAVVVGVWVGRNDGVGVPNLSGYSDALPVAARILRDVLPAEYWQWPEFEGAWKTVEMCSITGLPAAESCPSVYNEQIPVEQHVQRRCDVHYFRPSASGEQVQIRWPGSTQGWDLANIPVSANALAGEEGGVAATQRVVRGLEIVAPAKESVFLLAGDERGNRVRLRTSLDAVEDLFWYLNDRYLGLSRPEEPLLMTLEEGKHKLVCMRESGEWVQVRFSVRRP